MKLSTNSAVPVYTISGSSTARPLPDWLIRRRKRSLKQDPEFANRVELLQDFEFEEASSCVRVSEDGSWLMSTGTYKPQIHVHNLNQLSLAFARHTDTLNETFILLGSDYGKSLHLQTDRSIEFQTPGGCHYKTRIPRYGRGLVYDRRSTEALIPAVGVNEEGNGEVFRLNLEQGRFMKGYEVDVGGDDMGTGALQGSTNVGAVSAAAIAEESHNLLAFGTSLGTVEFWDPRSRNRCGVLSIPQYPSFDGGTGGSSSVSCLQFQRDGLTLATGDSAGMIHLYDLRSPIPKMKKDQGYGYPIQNLIFLDSTSRSRQQTTEPKILSSDKRIIKIWDQETGDPWTSVEPAVDLNHVEWCRDSGMLLTANEGKQQHSFFIPQLGPAPKWCAFLDNLVEEMAEDPNDPNSYGNTRKAGEVYDNYKFLTLPQLRNLNMDHLVGKTGLLRPYMHGFFVSQKLYEEAMIINNPTIWEEQRQKSIKEKVDKERESRIRGNKKVQVKVNRKLAEKILDREEKHERKKAQRLLKKKAEAGEEDEDMEDADAAPAVQNPETEAGGQKKFKASDIIKDERFAKLFQDEDFEIDETSREFQMHNPSTTVGAKDEAPRKLPKGLTAAEMEEMDDTRHGSSDEDDSESDVEDDKPKRREQKEFMNARQRKADFQAAKKPKMRVTTSSSSSKPSQNGFKAKNQKDRSFGSRATNLKDKRGNDRGMGRVRMGDAVGEKEISFVPERKGKSKDHSGFGGGRDGDGRRGSDRSGGGARNRGEDRRSASGNVFRRM